MSESIIEVIQKMVQEGQPRDKILKTLAQLGVSDEQAAKLLLIAEADTFTLLKKEIASMVREEFAGQKRSFEDVIHKDIESLEESEKKKVESLAISQLDAMQGNVMRDTKSFESRVNNAIGTSEKSVALVKVALDSINSRLAQSELDLEQIKVHKFRNRSMFFSYAMLGIGAIVLVVAGYLLFTKWQIMDASQVLIIAVLILASIILMFASILG